ncbi:MAG: CoA ester lyase [Burkholderiaceae bacterium]
MSLTTARRRPPHCRRSWLFVPGADEQALLAAPATQADVLMQELEDFTTPENRPMARRLSPRVLAAWRDTGVLCAVRINPLHEADGIADLQAIMPGQPDIVAMPKVDGADQIISLARAIDAYELQLGIEAGSTEILPNIESAKGLVNTIAIATASPRVKACLLASEDLATDLGAEREPDALELQYCRQRFLVECRAVGVEAIDYPYTWASGQAIFEREVEHARRLGYRAKSAVHPDHAKAINRLLTPSDDAVANARRVVGTFEEARQRGLDRVELDGSLVEVPTVTNAKRLIGRYEQLRQFDRDTH